VGSSEQEIKAEECVIDCDNVDCHNNRKSQLLIKIECLRQEIDRLQQINQDLQIALHTIAEHGDVIQAQLHETNQQLQAEVTIRRQTEDELRYQRQITERLLLNILPQPIAERLKQAEVTIADSFPDASVLFADIVNFTALSSHISPIELVELLNLIFSTFDNLTEQYELEKIKTIGDAYMVVGGVPRLMPDHVERIADMALAMQQEIKRFKLVDDHPITLRIGIHTGPVIAGVMGARKFIYDLWGDTVNIANRMESHGEAGRIQVTEAVYDRLKQRHVFQARGSVPIKGKGLMTTYWLIQ